MTDSENVSPASGQGLSEAHTLLPEASASEQLDPGGASVVSAPSKAEAPIPEKKKNPGGAPRGNRMERDLADLPRVIAMEAIRTLKSKSASDHAKTAAMQSLVAIKDAVTPKPSQPEGEPKREPEDIDQRLRRFELQILMLEAMAAGNPRPGLVLVRDQEDKEA